MQGPSLIFDKSSLESLNLDEAVLLDHYSAVITPVFFVECLADLEKVIRSKSTPEQLVGSLADRTPEYSRMTANHFDVLRAELSRQFDLSKALGRPQVPGGKAVQLGDQKGMIFQQSKEQEAMQRWASHEFLEAERGIAKWWRQSLMVIDLDAMSKAVMTELSPHLRKPKKEGRLELRSDLARTLYNLALLLEEQDPRQALPAAREARRLWEALINKGMQHLKKYLEAAVALEARLASRW